jgi:hypothetical protein
MMNTENENNDLDEFDDDSDQEWKARRIVHIANGVNELFYWNKKEAYTLLQVAGHQLPGGLPRDGFISSIRDTGSNVKTKYSGQIDSDLSL